MKRIILTSAIIFATVAGAFAQAPTSASDNATLNITLHKIQSIVVQSPKTVEMDYKTVSDYNTGVTVDELNHLSVFSVGGFEVKVRSAATDLTSAATEQIKSSGITIEASAGATTLGNAVTYAPAVSIDPIAKTLFTSTSGGINQQFNVQYKGDGNLAYASAGKFVNEVGESVTTVHTTTVTYSIEAK